MHYNFPSLLRLWVEAMNEQLTFLRKKARENAMGGEQRKQFDCDYTMFFSLLHICQFPCKQIYCNLMIFLSFNNIFPLFK